MVYVRSAIPLKHPAGHREVISIPKTAVRGVDTTTTTIRPEALQIRYAPLNQAHLPGVPEVVLVVILPGAAVEEVLRCVHSLVGAAIDPRFAEHPRIIIHPDRYFT